MRNQNRQAAWKARLKSFAAELLDQSKYEGLLAFAALGSPSAPDGTSSLPHCAESDQRVILSRAQALAVDAATGGESPVAIFGRAAPFLAALAAPLLSTHFINFVFASDQAEVYFPHLFAYESE